MSFVVLCLCLRSCGDLFFSRFQGIVLPYNRYIPIIRDIYSFCKNFFKKIYTSRILPSMVKPSIRFLYWCIVIFFMSSSFRGH